MRRACFWVLVLSAATLVGRNEAVYSQRLSSPHDFFSASSGFNADNCSVCHAAGRKSGAGVRRDLLNAEEGTVFTPYSSSTLDAQVGQPDGPSKLCLSCHDGTVARDNVGGIALSFSFSSDRANLGRDLSDDHPVSFVYDADLAARDGGLVDPTTTQSGLGGTIYHDLLVDGKMECTSCHDVHSHLSSRGLLRKPNKLSSLCLTCHIK